MGALWCLFDLTPSGWCKTDAHFTDFGLRIKQHLKDFLKLVDSLDLDVANRERMCLHLFQFFLLDYAAGGRLRKMIPEKEWTTIEELAQYEEERWNDPIFPKNGSLNYENANIELVLEIMECQVDMLIKDAISLIGKSETLCGLSSNEIRQLPLEPSHQPLYPVRWSFVHVAAPSWLLLSSKNQPWWLKALAYLKLSLGSSIYRVWELIDTPYRAMWDTTYWGFLRVGTKFDIFQNLHILYLEYSVLVFLDTAYWILFPSWSLVKCRNRYAVSSLMDIVYWLLEQ
ncbi:hypothetical protein Tco_0731805 [Tanacetum coccineum]